MTETELPNFIEKVERGKSCNEALKNEKPEKFKDSPPIFITRHTPSTNILRDIRKLLVNPKDDTIDGQNIHWAKKPGSSMKAL